MPPHTALSPLMLLTALLSSSKACPLILQPPELVQELGKAAVFICNTTADDHKGLSWTQGDAGPAEDLKSSIELRIPRIDRDTQAECTIKLNETQQCNKDVDIKVYKRPENVTLRSYGSAVKGHQLELRCEVGNVSIAQNLTVTWYRNDSKVKTEHFPATNTSTDVSSSLIWDVTERHGAVFICEAAETGPNGPLYESRDMQELSVRYAPEFEEKTSTVVWNSSDVSLRCEAAGDPPPHRRWVADGAPVANHTDHLNVSLGPAGESRTFQCVASNELGSDTKTFIVTAAGTSRPPNETTTAEPALRPQGCPLTIAPDKIVVRFGGSASANCSSADADAQGMGWEATTKGIGLTDVTHLEWRVNPVEAWTIKAQCFLWLKNGSYCTQTLSVTVWNPPDAVRVSPLGGAVMAEGRPHRLQCDAPLVAPVDKLRVNWYLGDQLVPTGGGDGGSILELTPEKKHDGANVSCEVELLLGQGPNPKFMSEPFVLKVQYKPSILSCPGKYAGRENSLQLASVPCKASGNPEPEVNWFFRDKKVSPTEARARGDSGSYEAQFTNTAGNVTTAVDITIEYAPEFSCRDLYNVTENSDSGHLCEPEGIPKPKTVWKKDGSEVVLQKKWTRQDTGQYSVTATNKHGQAHHTLSINVLYISSFAQDAETRQVTLGEGLILECSADGNPPPLLRWEKQAPAANFTVNTRGRHSSVNITEATSSHAGLYICTATNEVGSVSKQVTVTITEKSRTDYNVIIIAVVVTIVLLVLCIIVLCYRNYRKKSGHYDIISDSVPLTARP